MLRIFTLEKPLLFITLFLITILENNLKNEENFFIFKIQ